MKSQRCECCKKVIVTVPVRQDGPEVAFCSVECCIKNDTAAMKKNTKPVQTKKGRWV